MCSMETSKDRWKIINMHLRHACLYEFTQLKIRIKFKISFQFFFFLNLACMIYYMKTLLINLRAPQTMSDNAIKVWSLGYNAGYLNIHSSYMHLGRNANKVRWIKNDELKNYFMHRSMVSIDYFSMIFERLLNASVMIWLIDEVVTCLTIFCIQSRTD